MRHAGGFGDDVLFWFEGLTGDGAGIGELEGAGGLLQVPFCGDGGGVLFLLPLPVSDEGGLLLLPLPSLLGGAPTLPSE